MATMAIGNANPHCCECFLAKRNTVIVVRQKKMLTSIINASIKQDQIGFNIKKQHLSSFSAIFFFFFFSLILSFEEIFFL